MSQRIYLDYNATTPLSKLVKAELLRLLELDLGNPSSRHWACTPAAEIVELSRIRIAALIGCDPTEILFTSGGAEAKRWLIEVWFCDAIPSVLQVGIERWLASQSLKRFQILPNLPLDDDMQERLYAGVLGRIKLGWAINDLQQYMLLHVCQVDTLRNCR